MQEGYVDDVKEINYWQEQRRVLYYIYHYAIHLCKCSYLESIDLEIEPFIDYLIFELELKDDRGSDEVEIDW